MCLLYNLSNLLHLAVSVFFFPLTPFLSRLVSICWLIIESKLKLKEIFTITSVSSHLLQNKVLLFNSLLILLNTNVTRKKCHNYKARAEKITFFLFWRFCKAYCFQSESLSYLWLLGWYIAYKMMKNAFNFNP